MPNRAYPQAKFQNSLAVPFEQVLTEVIQQILDQGAGELSPNDLHYKLKEGNGVLWMFHQDRQTFPDLS